VGDVRAIVRALDEHQRVHGLTRRLGMPHHRSVELVQIVVVTPDVVAHVAAIDLRIDDSDGRTIVTLDDVERSRIPWLTMPLFIQFAEPRFVRHLERSNHLGVLATPVVHREPEESLLFTQPGLYVADEVYVVDADGARSTNGGRTAGPTRAPCNASPATATATATERSCKASSSSPGRYCCPTTTTARPATAGRCIWSTLSLRAA
jgi:hypothetical protein